MFKWRHWNLEEMYSLIVKFKQRTYLGHSCQIAVKETSSEKASVVQGRVGVD